MLIIAFIVLYRILVQVIILITYFIFLFILYDCSSKKYKVILKSPNLVED